MTTDAKLTFPPGVLGAEPMRLPILARGAGFIALAKPAHTIVSPEPPLIEAPAVLDALHAAIREGKPQVRALDLSYVSRVHALDAPATGVVVLATSPDAESALRNSAGSREWEFVYELLAETAEGAPDELTCELPLVVSADEPRVRVSHRAGKKSMTTFRLLERLGRYARWEARTAENRPHQIRVHAAENRLRIPGETQYGRIPLVYLSRLKRRYRPGAKDERPLHAPMCLHLRQVSLPDLDGGRVTVDAPLPRTLEVVYRRLREHGSGERRR